MKSWVLTQHLLVYPGLLFNFLACIKGANKHQLTQGESQEQQWGRARKESTTVRVLLTLKGGKCSFREDYPKLFLESCNVSPGF